jgi:hypothetical protein
MRPDVNRETSQSCNVCGIDANREYRSRGCFAHALVIHKRMTIVNEKTPETSS